MIASDLAARDMLVAAGCSIDSATKFVEIIASTRDAALADCKDLLAKVEARQDELDAIIAERNQYRRDYEAMSKRAEDLAGEVGELQELAGSLLAGLS